MRGFLLRAVAIYGLLFSAYAVSLAQSPIAAFPPGMFNNLAAMGGATVCVPDCMGDKYPGWSYYYSIDECYNFIYSGSVVDITDSATGNTTGTRIVCSNGVPAALVSGSACTFVTGNACSSVATTCTVACNVRTVYDQSGSGGGPYNLVQATNANRPTYTASCQNGHACAVCVRASSLGWASASGPTTTIDASGVTSNVFFMLFNPPSTPGLGILISQTGEASFYGAGTISKAQASAGGSNSVSATITVGTTYGALTQLFSTTSGLTSHTALNGSTTLDTPTAAAGTSSASGVITVCGTAGNQLQASVMSWGLIQIAAASFTFSAMNAVTHGRWNN